MGVVERLSFEMVSSHALIASEHLHRYELAARVCAGKTVVDLACGVGYGSEVLARAATSVLGVDNDAATIDSAQAAYRDRANLTFTAMDVRDFLRSDAARKAEAIVCFEGLEHFADPDEVLATLRDLAQAGTRIVISVPNSRAFEEENPHHVTDYGYEQALAAFEKLGASHILFQFLAEGSLIRARHPGEPEGRFVLTEHGEPEYANHFIGLVNVEEAELPVQDGRMQLEIAPLHNRFVRSLDHANRELRRANARLSRTTRGTFDSAAASILNRVGDVEERVRAAEEERDLWHREADKLQARNMALEHRAARLEAVRRRKVVRIALALARLRPGGR